MYTVYLLKLQDDENGSHPEINVLAEKLHDAQRAYCEYLGLDYYFYEYDGWELSQELTIHCPYDLEA